MNRDAATKQSYHEQCFTQIHSKLQKHVDYLVNELEELGQNSWRKDIEKHPRLPLLMAHNDLILAIFERVQSNIDNMI